MTKSELIDRLAEQQKHLAHVDVELGVKAIIEQMSARPRGGDRIEIRGFGSFSLHYRAPRAWAVTPKPAMQYRCPANMFLTSSPAKHCANGLTTY